MTKLIGGNIPAGEPCPYICQCMHFNKIRCPSSFKLIIYDYACVMARLFENIDNEETGNK
jgi:hypothetical protein